MSCVEKSIGEDILLEEIAFLMMLLKENYGNEGVERKRMQYLDDFKNSRKYWILKEEDVD
jgi:hypothetical protein